MDLVEGAIILALIVFGILGFYLWHRGKSFRAAKEANRGRPGMNDGMPTRSGRRL